MESTTRKSELLEQRIGYSFEDQSLLDRALTTVSKANEMRKDGEQLPYDEKQEALATLGDGVLRLLVVEWLILEKHMNKKGPISKLTGDLVSRTHLGLLAEKLALEEFVVWGEGEFRREEWHRSTRMLAECLEALVGAVFLDGGINSCREMLLHVGFLKMIDP
ncbi:MAG: ribonuclease III [Methanomassiliicoccales archaeon]|nr:ribonuclease III [Methanomassiliicoccales archaeon]NYT15061.1 ribonuclease III [Methanomassiliicoccales archaeon]